MSAPLVYAAWVALALPGVLACNTDDSLVVPVKPSPAASAAAGTLPSPPPAPTDLCDTVECCQALLGVGASACVSATLQQGHCAIQVAPNGTTCGSASACGAPGTCQAGQCQAPPTLELDCTSLDGPCAVGECDPEAGGCVARPRAGLACDDGSACTVNDVCSAKGECGGEALTCDDLDPCTEDSCDPAAGCTAGPSTCVECTSDQDCPVLSACVGKQTCADGQCQLIPDSGACDGLSAHECQVLNCDAETGVCAAVALVDGDACDDGDLCTSGETCTAGECTGSAVVCDDQNPCTVDQCEPDVGCAYAPTTGGACDDGDACTEATTCANGTCVGTAVQCDDNDPCTDDACTAAAGCQNEPATGPACDDGDACTAGDTCAQGACEGTPVDCGCETDLDCVNDDNLCNGVLVCGPLGTCVLAADSVVVCPADASPGDCQTLACEPSTGQCTVQAKDDGSACSDGKPCTEGDLCTAGECIGAPIACDDGNVCTTDNCAPASGCVFLNNTEPCDDGDACTEGDVCGDGACAPGATVDCNDGELCTADSCTKKSGCKHSPIAGACDDDDACTSADSCVNGECVGSAVACVAGSACEVAVCDPASGCTKTEKSCDDSDACTTDSCGANGCEHSAVVCSDSDACTTDSCVGSGCQFVPVLCADNDPCTLDACDGGVCAYTPVVCNDSNPCTEDSCVDGGCVYAAVGCDDNIACTQDSCLPDGTCVNAPIQCDDGVECTTDACVDGACAYVANAALCDDSNPCTADVCAPETGCTYSNTSAGCNDGDACTSGDTCVAGHCEPLLYTCGPCVGKVDGQSCDDGDAATQADMCLRGWCRGFEKHLVAGPGGGAFTIEHVSSTNGEYVAVVSEQVTTSDITTTRSSLAALSLDGDLDVIDASTTTTSAWAGLSDGYAVGSSLSTVQLDDTGWTLNGSLRSALLALNVAEVSSASLNAVWHDPASGVTFVAGTGENAEAKRRAWLSRCAAGTCALDAFSYAKFSEVEVPRALSGVGGATPLAILTTDYASSSSNPRYYSDAFRRTSLEPDIKWDTDNFDVNSSDNRANDVHAAAANNAFWVGDGGFLRSRGVDGSGKASWAKLSNLWNGQGGSRFGGVWVNSRVALVATTATVVGSTVELQLVTHPAGTNVATSGNWRRLSFGTAAPVNAPCLGTICLPLGARSAQVADVWSDGETIVVVGWQVPEGESVRKALILVRRLL